MTPRIDPDTKLAQVRADVQALLDWDIICQFDPSNRPEVPLAGYRRAVDAVLTVPTRSPRPRSGAQSTSTGDTAHTAYIAGRRAALIEVTHAVRGALTGEPPEDSGVDATPRPPGPLPNTNLLLVFDGDGVPVASFPRQRQRDAYAWAADRSREPLTVLPVVVLDLAQGRGWRFTGGNRSDHVTASGTARVDTSTVAAASLEP
jgi:hypothetical protein